MKLIVGLGNPSKEYENTRHNVGFMVLDNYAIKNKLSSKQQNNGIYYRTIIGDEKVILLKPQNFINLSGEVIMNYINYYKINIEDVLVIHDDMDTECGDYRLKPMGGSAGHNGLKSIEDSLQTKDYKRLKIGISRNVDISDKDYVLGKFSKTDKEKIDRVIDTAFDIINEFPLLSFENLMNKYNKKDN